MLCLQLKTQVKSNSEPESDLILLECVSSSNLRAHSLHKKNVANVKIIFPPLISLLFDFQIFTVLVFFSQIFNLL